MHHWGAAARATPSASEGVYPAVFPDLTRMRLVGVAPPNLAALFPDFCPDRRQGRRGTDGAAAAAGSAAARVTTGAWQTALRLSRRGLVLRVRPGLLQTPRFGPSLPWLSGTIVGGVERGVRLPGAAERALDGPSDPESEARAAAAAARIRAGRLGGTAWADPPPEALLRDGAGRLAVVHAPEAADPALVRRMVRGATERGDASRTLVLLPAQLRRFGQARLADEFAAMGCRVLGGLVDPWPIIEAAEEFHVADGGPVGLLALIAGREVHCHAPCWYSGRGLTADAPDVPARGSARSLAQVLAAGLVAGAHYADPFRNLPSSLEAALGVAEEWRRVCDANRGIACCTGMQFWKRRRIAQFLHTGTHPPDFARGTEDSLEVVRQQRRLHTSPAAGRAGAAVAAWSSRMPAGLERRAAEEGVSLLRVEDGFIRSRGLGSDFLPPCSIILDGGGIYYDPNRPSDLERILSDAAFPDALLSRARTLVAQLVAGGVTKYGVGGPAAAADAPLVDLPRDGRRVLLVPGQVADDLSVRLGGAGVGDNAELLRRVRTANPDAAILYKPHPDVDAGHRLGAVPDQEVLRLADRVVRDIPIAALIQCVDEVHTLTSLAGFEALLRAKPVTAWGQPFYAGWGLTSDMAPPMPRRRRRLRLEELAAGVLLLYPRYLDPVTGMPCPADVVMERLTDPTVWRPGPLVRLRRLQGQAAKRLRRSVPLLPAASGRWRRRTASPGACAAQDGPDSVAAEWKESA